MNRIIYLNGAWLPEAEAKVSIFDRGYVFGDAIYEVTAVARGRLMDYAAHVARLKRSVGEIALALPVSDNELLAIHREIVARNHVDEGLIYLQVSRGPADRDFHHPEKLQPTLSLFTQAKKYLEDGPAVKSGIAVISLPDLRWARRDIKTVQLLYPSMAKMEAEKHGAQDAFLVEDGFVTEATSSTAHIITAKGGLVTRQLSHAILPGITRSSILSLARKAGIPVEERAFTIDEAKNAAEAFITSATQLVQPVVKIDGVAVGNGKPGPVTICLRRLYTDHHLDHLI